VRIAPVYARFTQAANAHGSSLATCHPSLLTFLIPLGAFPKRLAIVPWDLITLALRKVGRIDPEGSNNTGCASIMFQFQPKYNSAIDHEKKARL
jgi:hypothetical protein